MTTTTVCEPCSAYMGRRAHVLAPHFDVAALRRVVAVSVVVREHLHAVHLRHLAGRSLSTRPYTEAETWLDAGGNRHTRIVVKRCCNGCGDEIGDATPIELATAVSGDPLPDVRLECGCFGSRRDRSAA